MLWKLLLDSFQAGFDLLPPFFKQQILGNDCFSKQAWGSHVEVKYVALWNIHLKQLSNYSRSDSDEYTESRMKLVDGECLSGKKRKEKGNQESCGFS